MLLELETEGLTLVDEPGMNESTDKNNVSPSLPYLLFKTVLLTFHCFLLLLLSGKYSWT